MFTAVTKINNPKSENNGMWCVSVSKGYMKPFETVYMNKSKKVCVEYAKKISEMPIVSNGVEYGCKF